jgi:hypothetical protein
MNWIYTPLNEYEIWMNCFFARNNDHLTLSLTDEENLMRWFILDLHTVISDEESRISLFYAGIWIGLAYAGSGRNSSHAKPLVTLLATGRYYSLLVYILAHKALHQVGLAIIGPLHAT